MYYICVNCLEHCQWRAWQFREARVMKKNYFTQFDTIRFLAMLGIILYHYLTHRVSGGFLGVDIFLVLSGYLVTSQMESKYKAGIQESYFKKTWGRIRKVWWPMVIITMVCAAFQRRFRIRMRTKTPQVTK